MGFWFNSLILSRMDSRVVLGLQTWDMFEVHPETLLFPGLQLSP